MNKNSLALIGCFSEGLEILLEIASLDKGFDEFHVFENLTESTNLKPFYLSHRNVVSHLAESDTTYKNILQSLPLSFGVVDIESKPLVYSYFQEKYHIKPENFIQLIHPSSVIATSTVLENGILVESLCTISSFANIGFGVTIKRNCSVGHHAIIGKYSTLNPGVHLSSAVHIGEGTMLGTGTVVKDGIRIGSNTIIGLGSVVVKDIPSNVVAFGNPCKIIRNREVNV
jgi:sugar O-acyltransferase (sialic acid O-acetyltransferase NeuD family)